MSHIVNCGLFVQCNVPVSANLDSYLWYVADSAINSAAQRAAVVAQIAAYAVPTGYAARTRDPSVTFGGYAWPTTLWIFVVAIDTDGSATLGTDTLQKDVCG
jgi:hypothetical protein